MSDVVIVGGQNTGSGRQATETFGNGRRCTEPSCRKPLSIYNPAETCSSHRTSTVRLTSPSKSAMKSLMDLLNS